MEPQITILTCTRNGENNIRQVLEAIANQTDVSRDLSEVLVIDNASSDRTAEIATAAIQELHLNGRVLSESRVGKINALLTGIKAARGELISIIDDDNFIEPGFIYYTLALFQKYPNVGMVGSKNSILTDKPIPDWFKFAQNRYACSKPYLRDVEEQDSEGVTVANFAIIPGAGSTFRVKPFQQCLEKGYRFFNDTQRGKNMKVNGEDAELCWLLYSLGYQFAYDPRIQVRHAISAERLDLNYFKRLCITQGSGEPGTDPFIFTYKYEGDRLPLRWTWQWQLLSRIKRFIRVVFFPENVGNTDEERQFRNWIARMRCWGEIKRILFERSNYTQHIRQVAGGAWTELRVR